MLYGSGESATKLLVNTLVSCICNTVFPLSDSKLPANIVVPLFL